MPSFLFFSKPLLNQKEENISVPFFTAKHDLSMRFEYPGEIINSSIIRDFPGGSVVKNLPANAGDTGSSPGLGRSHMLRST